MRRVWVARAIIVVATVLCLVAWGRVLGVGLTQPSRWHEITVTTADGQVVPGDEFRCRLNAFGRDGLIYRACDREDADLHVVAVDPARRTAVASGPLPPTFTPARWFAAVAADPAGGLTVVGSREFALARLYPDGRIEALPTPPDAGLLHGIGWRDGRLELVAARVDEGEGGPVTVTAYTPGGSWSAPAALPAPACGSDAACTPLVANLGPDGWAVYYARAPRQPADPTQVAAEILRVGPDGTTRMTQTIALTAESRAFRVEGGELRWSSRIADRSGGNILNYGAPPILRQGADGRFAPLPPPPADLLDDAADIPAYRRPELSPLSESYAIVADRLIWQPVYNSGGFAGATERALLRDDRWVVLQRTSAGLHLEERPLDPTASSPSGTFTARGPLILGQQEDVLSFSDYSAPLLPAAGGGYWLLGQSNEIIRIGPDLRRLDGHGSLERFGNLFADFGGALDDRFHREAIWPKRLALGWLLFAWPPLALLAWLRGRRAADDDFATPARLTRAALLFAILGAASLPWFWMATQYF